MGIKPTALQEFYRSLHGRGVTTDGLAEQIGLSGGAVRRILSGHRRKSWWWPRFAALLTKPELKLLKDVEQCATWNSKHAAKRPRWTVAKAEQFGK
jgi:hypothetical protein